MAVLSKGGCNAGRCHGNAHGRGGFKLSLRGQIPADDFLAITREAQSRRINRVHPRESLLLLKATGQVPHEGGLRFSEQTPEYAAVLGWIAAGMPHPQQAARHLQRIVVKPRSAIVDEGAQNGDRLQLQVTAYFDDGITRDVTDMAVYEPADMGVEVSRGGEVMRRKFGQSTVVVRYLQRQTAVNVAFLKSAPDFAFHAPLPHNAIDVAVFRQLRRLRINPSRTTTDVEFVRRVHLDLTGQLPTAEVARQFVADPSTEKRARLIEQLLASAPFADHWARVWADLLRVEEKTMDAEGVRVFHAWIHSAIESDTPQDQFVREILAARGSTYKQPPANFYRALRKPDLRAEAIAQVFLGTRLQCAKCHDHPFEQWTQDDYYDFAALFAPIQYKVIENKRRDKFDKNQFIGEQVVWLDADATLEHPRTGHTAKGRFLGRADASGEYVGAQLDEFARWVTAADHPLFARVLVNRVWAELTGRGVVEPVDDFRITNPPSNAELLDVLTEEFVHNGFQLRPLLRFIANSRVYQLSSDTNESNSDDERNFSRARIARLPAEELLDALSQVTEVPTGFDGYPLGMRAGQLPGINKEYRREAPVGGLKFLKLFGKPERIMTCACERSNETTLGQVFELTSGEVLQEKLSAPHNCLSRLLGNAAEDAAVLDELYWTALSRPPTAEETAALQAYITGSENRRAAYEDVLWGLLNSKEFLMRR